MSLQLALLTHPETAQRLGITEEQLTAFVQDGEIAYINVGRGKKRPRRRYTEQDISEFFGYVLLIKQCNVGVVIADPFLEDCEYFTGFVAKSKADVDSFHAAGLANGGTCDGPPGMRGEQYHDATDAPVDAAPDARAGSGLGMPRVEPCECR